MCDAYPRFPARKILISVTCRMFNVRRYSLYSPHNMVCPPLLPMSDCIHVTSNKFRDKLKQPTSNNPYDNEEWLRRRMVVACNKGPVNYVPARAEMLSGRWRYYTTPRRNAAPVFYYFTPYTHKLPKLTWTFFIWPSNYVLYGWPHFMLPSTFDIIHFRCTVARARMTRSKYKIYGMLPRRKTWGQTFYKRGMCSFGNSCHSQNSKIASQFWTVWLFFSLFISRDLWVAQAL